MEGTTHAFPERQQRIALGTHPHTRDLAVRSRAFPRLADGEEEEGEEVEDVGEQRVEAVVVRDIVLADVVELRDCEERKRG